MWLIARGLVPLYWALAETTLLATLRKTFAVNKTIDASDENMISCRLSNVTDYLLFQVSIDSSDRMAGTYFEWDDQVSGAHNSVESCVLCRDRLTVAPTGSDEACSIE